MSEEEAVKLRYYLRQCYVLARRMAKKEQATDDTRDGRLDMAHRAVVAVRAHWAETTHARSAMSDTPTPAQMRAMADQLGPGRAGEYLRQCAEALETLKARDWQPIETAPKDGTWIVIVGPIWGQDALFRGLPRACVSRWFSEEDHRESPAWACGWCFVCPGYSSTMEPTHWMPLPKDSRS